MRPCRGVPPRCQRPSRGGSRVRWRIRWPARKWIRHAAWTCSSCSRRRRCGPSPNGFTTCPPRSAPTSPKPPRRCWSCIASATRLRAPLPRQETASWNGPDSTRGSMSRSASRFRSSTSAPHDGKCSSPSATSSGTAPTTSRCTTSS